MSCKACERDAGIYDFNCLACCIRLLVDSRPNRKKQEAMLAVIERFPGSPAREKIIEKLKGKS